MRTMQDLAKGFGGGRLGETEMRGKGGGIEKKTPATIEEGKTKKRE